MLKFLNISAILTVSQIFMLQQFSIVISHWSGLAVIGVTFLFTIIRFLILEIIIQYVSIYYSRIFNVLVIKMKQLSVICILNLLLTKRKI